MEATSSASKDMACKLISSLWATLSLPNSATSSLLSLSLQVCAGLRISYSAYKTEINCLFQSNTLLAGLQRF
jgi:hypothetical protein